MRSHEAVLDPEAAAGTVSIVAESRHENAGIDSVHRESRSLPTALAAAAIRRIVAWTSAGKSFT
jgi:tRNA1(Val) A37 N6-methylase TrmN6